MREGEYLYRTYFVGIFSLSLSFSPSPSEEQELMKLRMTIIIISKNCSAELSSASPGERAREQWDRSPSFHSGNG
jgi:hypothetical protein